MSSNPQEQHESTVDTQRSIAQRSLDTHNGGRPTQGKMGNDTERWREVEAANGGLRK
jgi:hypothetical protein